MQCRCGFLFFFFPPFSFSRIVQRIGYTCGLLICEMFNFPKVLMLWDSFAEAEREAQKSRAGDAEMSGTDDFGFQTLSAAEEEEAEEDRLRKIFTHLSGPIIQSL